MMPLWRVVEAWDEYIISLFLPLKNSKVCTSCVPNSQCLSFYWFLLCSVRAACVTAANTHYKSCYWFLTHDKHATPCHYSLPFLNFGCCKVLTFSSLNVSTAWFMFYVWHSVLTLISKVLTQFELIFSYIQIIQQVMVRL